MVQVGHNAGPRDARVYSHVKNFKASITQEDQVQGNQEIFSICSLFWNLVRSRQPCNITTAMVNALVEAGAPHISAPGVEDGESNFLT
jgi:hypothetical protein